MNKNLLLMFCILNGFVQFHNIQASELKENSVIGVGYMAIPDKQCFHEKPFFLITKQHYDPKNLIGSKLVQVGSSKNLRAYGLEEEFSLIALHVFLFADGSQGFVGVPPAGSLLHRLPSSPDDSFDIKLCDGKILSVELSKEPNSKII